MLHKLYGNLFARSVTNAVLKSPFLKWGFGGLSDGYIIPPPPFNKGGKYQSLLRLFP